MVRHASPFEQSPSPPPQPLTKRDVRRNRIMEKLQGMIDTFSSNQTSHYRAQLQALQVDMTLVLRADPYPSGGPEWTGVLDDSGEDIKSLIAERGVALPTDEAAQKDFAAMAGGWYRQFVKDVNDCIEQRDANLTALHNHYTASVAELDRLTQHKLRQAEEEHKALTSTVRQRLITSITKKRQQLLRDKEQLDIADSNALLLHPGHFSINNPGSPPNGFNRKTRHLRHRQGSPNPGDLEGNGKKKRKAAALDDDGNESPAPNLRQVQEPWGSRSPFREARDKTSYTQYEAPAYSLERIFTDKELAMATDTAKLATWRYFNQPPEQQQEQDSNGVDTAVASIADEIAEGAEMEEVVVVAPTTEDAEGTPPVPEPAAAAVEMERSASHQVLTRGGARANPLAALHDLAAIATSERAAGGGAGLTTSRDPFAPVVPSYHAVTRSEKSGAPAPSGVSHVDMENDFTMMRQSASRAHAANDDAEELPAANADVDEEDEEEAARMRRELLDQALGESSVSQPYRLPLLETGPAVIGKGVERIPGTLFAPVPSFEQKIRQQLATPSLTAGGAMAAALQGKLGAGGEPMSRTTSAGGRSDVVDNVGGAGPGRRGRGRAMV